jgi:hypothetical protein
MAHLWEMAVSLIKSILTFDQFFLYQMFSIILIALVGFQYFGL